MLYKTINHEHDILWVKHCKEPLAYSLIQTFFLKNKLNRHYDYLVITPDDLVLNKKSLDILINELESPSLPKEPDRNNESIPYMEGDFYSVLSGICNFGCGSEYDIQHGPVITEGVPSNKEFMFDFDKGKLMNLAERYVRSAGKIIPVKFAGFPLTFIHRSVFDVLDMRANDYDQCTDLTFSSDLERKEIVQYCHLDAMFLHIREIDHPYLRINTYNFDVDEKKKRMMFLPAKP